LRLAGRAAIVTGGAHGIGRAVVERFLAEGARVLFLDIDADGGRGVVDELGGGRLQFVRADVAVEADVAAAVARAVERFGGVDVLVNDAGVNAYFDATAMSEDEWERFMGVDLKSAGSRASTRSRTCGAAAARSSTSRRSTR
jgi:NAD(P)-dependent dehydrogenase (short-subunit alcohol dehydrogenase family)